MFHTTFQTMIHFALYFHLFSPPLTHKYTNTCTVYYVDTKRLRYHNDHVFGNPLVTQQFFKLDCGLQTRNMDREVKMTFIPFKHAGRVDGKLYCDLIIHARYDTITECACA